MGKYDYLKGYTTGLRVSRKEEDVETPKFTCATCDKCNGDRCTVFGRHVIKDLHKCFYHSCYDPITTKFDPKVVVDFERMLIG